MYLNKLSQIYNNKEFSFLIQIRLKYPKSLPPCQTKLTIPPTTNSATVPAFAMAADGCTSEHICDTNNTVPRTLQRDANNTMLR